MAWPMLRGRAAMNFLLRAAAVCAAAMCLSRTSSASASTNDDELAPRHRLTASIGGGYGVSSALVYDEKFHNVSAWQFGADYTYRVTRNMRVGLDGTRLFFGTSSERVAELWTASPTVGFDWASGAIEAGVRLGFGFVHGTREIWVDRPRGSGFGAEVMGEVAWGGSWFDLVGRTGFRYVRVHWNEERRNEVNPDDLGVLALVATIGVRAKL